MASEPGNAVSPRPQAPGLRAEVSSTLIPERSIRMTRSFSTHRQTNPKPRRTFRPQAEGLEGRQLLSAGALDTTFGTGGYTLAGPTSAQAVQIQADGKILAAGH